MALVRKVGAGVALPFLRGTPATSVEERVRSHEQGPPTSPWSARPPSPPRARPLRGRQGRIDLSQLYESSFRSKECRCCMSRSGASRSQRLIREAFICDRPYHRSHGRGPERMGPPHRPPVQGQGAGFEWLQELQVGSGGRFEACGVEGLEGPKGGVGRPLPDLIVRFACREAEEHADAFQRHLLSHNIMKVGVPPERQGAEIWLNYPNIQEDAIERIVREAHPWCLDRALSLLRSSGQGGDSRATVLLIADLAKVME